MRLIKKGELPNNEPREDVYQLSQEEFDALENKPRPLEIYAVVRNDEEVFYFIPTKFIKK